MFDRKDKIKQAIAGPPNIIHSYFDNIFNTIQMQKNPLIKESKREVHSYEKFNDVTDKQFDHTDLNYAVAKIGKGTRWAPWQVVAILTSIKFYSSVISVHF